MQCTLVRHGQSTYNLENRFTGDVDVPLTPFGREEAHAAGKKLQQFVFDKAYTSVLVRAEATLQIILQEIGQSNLPIERSAALNERRYGDLQGLNKAKTAIKYGEAQVLLWRRSFDVRPPSGESLEDTYNRAVPYFIREIAPKLLTGNNILIVAHGNSLRALMMYLEHTSKKDIVLLNIPTGVPKQYQFDSNLQLIRTGYL